MGLGWGQGTYDSSKAGGQRQMTLGKQTLVISTFPHLYVDFPTLPDCQGHRQLCLEGTDAKKYSKVTRKTHRHKSVGEQAAFGKATFPLV